jgi:hypothetical protein
LKTDRREYLKLYRKRLKGRAIQAVADYWSRQPVCFGCGSSDFEKLTFDHKNGYAPDSVTDGSSDRRHREAIANPERFDVLCWSCHLKKTWRDIAKHKFVVDAKSGMQMSMLRTKGDKIEKARLDRQLDTEAREVYERDDWRQWNERARRRGRPEMTLEEFRELQARARLLVRRIGRMYHPPEDPGDEPEPFDPFPWRIPPPRSPPPED